MVVTRPRTLIVDNGGHTIKMGWNTDENPRVIPNSIVKGKNERKRVFVGEELSECTDRSSLFFLLPLEKGYIVNWDVQQQIWERSLRDESQEDSRIVLTHPNALVPAIKDESCEILFEMFGFGQVFKSSTAGLVGQCKRQSRVVLVVDSGFSFTHVVPFLDGKIIQEGVVRMDIGGKLLTNQLKEWVSYRELNVVEETFVMNECKEDACFVSMQFDKDSEIARCRGEENTMVREYVLPDFSTRQRGILREPVKAMEEEIQKIRLNMERFSVPEALFNPSNIGINQMGVAECIVHSVCKCPENLREALLQNLYLIGGNIKFTNFQQRLLEEVSSMVEWKVSLSGDMDGDDPIERGWRAGKRLVNGGTIERRFLTKEEYAEEGEEACTRAFLHFHRGVEKMERDRDNQRERRQ
ncbi:hypothetical protein PENTCL1PPCAC_6484 [Pristionchus entomophagus]|uniref:Actin n=1 Tax=Pristionchus entomophagus TaxID=358040 RepID=A0AAV5SVP1_9BILA|nr:hypothetical protein PENTCL1PPCAC_6484 [Pristionchus entomophagus]